MMKRRAEYRNEVKTRLRPQVYERLQVYKRKHGIETDSAALCHLLEIACFGLVPETQATKD
jgi:hypothetical protein